MSTDPGVYVDKDGNLHFDGPDTDDQGEVVEGFNEDEEE